MATTIHVIKVDFNVKKTLDWLSKTGNTVETLKQTPDFEIGNTGLKASDVNLKFVENKKIYVNYDLSVDKVLAIEELTVIPNITNENGEPIIGYRIWLTPNEKDCWWVTAESYNIARGALTSDALKMHKPVDTSNVL